MQRPSRWDHIKAEYIASDIGYRPLADKYNVSMSTLSKRAAREDWPGLRKKHEAKVAKQALEKAAKGKLSRMGSVEESLDGLSTFMSAVINDDELRSAYIREGRDLNDFARALATVESLTRRVYGIPTEEQREAQRIAGERLELERKRVEAAVAADKPDEDLVVTMEGIPEDWLR